MRAADNRPLLNVPSLAHLYNQLHQLVLEGVPGLGLLSHEWHLEGALHEVRLSVADLPLKFWPTIPKKKGHTI